MRQFILRQGSSVPERLKDLIDTLDLTKPQKVVISEYKDSRSDRQLSTYWMWVTIIADEMGYTKNEMHSALLEELAPKKIVNIKGKSIAVALTTSGMNQGQMSEYMNHVVIFAADNGINLPMPEDYLRSFR